MKIDVNKVSIRVCNSDDVKEIYNIQETVINGIKFSLITAKYLSLDLIDSNGRSRTMRMVDAILLL